MWSVKLESGWRTRARKGPGAACSGRTMATLARAVRDDLAGEICYSICTTTKYYVSAPADGS
jgi:hypothetical protein